MEDFDFSDVPAPEVVEAPVAPEPEVVADEAGPVKALGPVAQMKASLGRYDGALAEILAQAQAVEVVDDESQSRAVGMTGQLKRLAKALEEDRKRLVGPLNNTVKVVNNLAAGYKAKLTTAEMGLKGKLDAYRDRQEVARREAERVAREAQEKAQAELDAQAQAAGVESVQLPEPVIPAAPTTIRTEGGTAYTAAVVEVEVENADEVPREFLVVDLAAAKKAAVAGRKEIPGIKITRRTETRVRS